jgi:hypothetical protein
MINWKLRSTRFNILMKKNECATLLVIIATGISSVAVQLITIREFLAQFHGNEFVISLILFSWLILGGIGTLVAHLITPHYWQPSSSRLCWLSLCSRQFGWLLSHPCLHFFYNCSILPACRFCSSLQPFCVKSRNTGLFRCTHLYY